MQWKISTAINKLLKFLLHGTRISDTIKNQNIKKEMKTRMSIWHPNVFPCGTLDFEVQSDNGELTALVSSFTGFEYV